MGCNLKNFSSYLNELLQAGEFEDVAVNGIQVEGKAKISRMAVAVSASLDVIKQACSKKVDLLLVHHGLFFKEKGKELPIAGTLKEKLKLLLTHNISLVAYHLPLDAHVQFGNNWGAARALGFKNLAPFGIYQGKAIGVKGAFKACPRAEFQKKLEKFYGQKAHTALGGKEIISSCALVSGGAHKLVYEAALAGVDAYVTGSFDEPIWHAAFEEKINFFALGHAATEKIGVKLLGAHLEDHFDLDVIFIDEPNPF
jgi:dinuclear metal center YbgI/SA1388 family protein